MKQYVQECIHKNCKQIFYVPKHELGVPKMCEKCSNKTGEERCPPKEKNNTTQ